MGEIVDPMYLIFCSNYYYRGRYFSIFSDIFQGKVLEMSGKGKSFSPDLRQSKTLTSNIGGKIGERFCNSGRIYTSVVVVFHIENYFK